MTSRARPMLQDRLIHWWWVRLPLRTARWFPGLGIGLSDGLYLVRWPQLAAFAPLVVLLLGVGLGALHPGETFTYSLVVMACMAAIGLSSVNLGWWVLLGFAMGDFLLRGHETYSMGGVEALLRVRVPLLISYYLLGLLTVGLPMMTVALRLQVRMLRLTDRLKLPLEAIVYALAIGVLVYSWAQSTAVLIRPVFTWRGGQPSVEDIAPLQMNGHLLAGFAVILAFARFVVEARAAGRQESMLAQVLGLAFPMVLGQRRRLMLNDVIALIISAVGLTLLLAGLMSGFLDGTLVFAFFVLLLWMRDQLFRQRPPWLQLIGRIPLLLRFAAGLILGYYGSRLIVAALWNTTQTLRPILIASCLMIAIMALLTISVQPAVELKKQEARS